MKELKEQLVSALLVILTVAALISAGINFQQQSKFRLTEDGVTWIDINGQVVAVYLAPSGPGVKAGLRKGDRLLAIGGVTILQAIEATQVLARIGAWTETEYRVVRDGVEIKPKLVTAENQSDRAVYYQYCVGAAYLIIGLFVYFRRGNASKALHFFALCLASFILSCFHYSGKLNNFDKVIYWGNVTANMFAPTIFLHFCLTFPAPPNWLRSRLRIFALYIPACLLVAVYAGVANGWIRSSEPLLTVLWTLDRTSMAFLALLYSLGGIWLWIRLGGTEDPVLRNQLKWLRNGTLLGVLPFLVFYVLPYVVGFVPTQWMKLSVLSLGLIPVTWAYAILRHRLMDVDVIFQQGYVYTLATLSVLGIFYGLLFSVSKAGDVNGTALVALILIAVFVFQPIRNWLQELLDRHYFYRDRYDYRRTLIEFARELSAQTDLDALLRSVGDRLVHTLQLRHVACFVQDEGSGQFVLQMSTSRHIADQPLDLRFLSPSPDKPFLFFERTRTPFDMALDALSSESSASVRHTVAELDLTYYVPCSVRGRTIAYLGVSRTDKGDFLASDDVDLLVTLSGYLGVAIENARLYHSLQRKAGEYERLKEFSENIVESINVGILAADLEDRVESWNTQIERLTGITRDEAVGRKLSELFPAAFYDQCEEVRGETGVHNIYKFPLRQKGSGREVVLNVAIAPLVSKEMEQIGRLIIFDDVTDRAELEKRLIQADKLSSIGLLAAGVAHEVNTPLAVISTYAQMLTKQVSGDDQKSKLLDKIARQTFRASQIVNSLLNFSRTSPTDFGDVDLNRIIRETAGLIDHQMQKTRVQVALQLDDRLPNMKGDSGKLQQVFLNLFLNARDAMEAGGTLVIRTWSETAGEKAEPVLRVDVSDTGCGIAASDLPRIYDPFFTTKGAKKGTGLGLSVTYGIIREHGGTIEVESEVGKGTRFHLEFPVVRKPIAKPAPPPTVLPTGPLEKVAG